MTLTLNELIDISGGTLVGQPQELTFDHITLNSKELRPGSLFAALPGLHAHGARFAAGSQAAAILTDEAGAQLLAEGHEVRPVVVVEDIRAILGKVSAEVFGNPSKQLTIIGVTGTSGKTTTTYLLEAGLIAEGHTVGLIGTTGTRIDGVPVPTSLTTPEAPKLQELFQLMVEKGVSHVVMEVSSHAISLGRITGTRFAAGGFTNLSQDHLDFHATMEEYFQAKAGFFATGSQTRAETAVIMIDDDWGQKMAAIAGTDAITVSTTGQPAAITAGEVSVDAAGVQNFTVTVRGESFPVTLTLPGQFNVANATLAIALAAETGSDLSRFISGIANVGVPGRMERIDEGQGFLAVVDYAHKPAAVAAVLDSVRSQINGRLGVVLGAGGDRDPLKRPLMGAAAVERADFVVITDDNPRSEDPATIRAAVMEGATKASADMAHAPELHEIGDRGQAIIAAVEWAQPGDAIIVAGKGHENGQLIAGVNHPFDDREHVRAALKNRQS
ncbi:UDP-N-acetylmuramoyl-L-alanyl-D-glutamate--2,6-diaminopimelate ligase [Corynebacterium epidermidicanis]|uniref:UDP-N-acetylmuramoyl-L-alanyl-D-glutamate--2,6-diaminopimelate ligase n=1 Tax=Corynebacterium epidermidicanis TaxID=1050174 RepID=A0A0G3GQP8_9CORY|nr:UDP-N-acetylmuramoyl-L-alanyl-D-glutamate--2,6-diaminopimelate ligase [Corynebacterium epidermidicanis]AKK03526.1 UDP-N-acetylmuramoylalanyl-D-glutamate--2,6-diaminopimelate ligase [Corynebacterium epidermidicanis]